MDSESWDLLHQCKMLDFQAGMAIGFAEGMLRMRKQFLAIDEALQRAQAETDAEERHLQE